MTMQMLDSFSYKGKRAEAVAISPRFTFTPANNFGIETDAWGTSNYRGFWCDYVIDELFMVRNLYLYTKKHEYPILKGQRAEEIPEFVRIIKEANRESQAERRYVDGFPMQYKSIDYPIEYSGKIVIGIIPEENKSGQERYINVYELLFNRGFLVEETDITGLWKAFYKKDHGKIDGYWWAEQSNNYFELINYSFMGVGDNKDG